MVICRAWAMDRVVAMVRIRMKRRHSFFMFFFSRLAISTLAKKIAPIRIPALTTMLKALLLQLFKTSSLCLAYFCNPEILYLLVISIFVEKYIFLPKKE